MKLSPQAAAVLDLGQDLPRALRPDRHVRKGRTQGRIKAFYGSWQWKRVRYQILKERGRKCECCRAAAADDKIVVDHIKPVRHFWHLRLDPKNLQVLCDGCNRGKGSHDETDWRGADDRTRRTIAASSDG